jgi:photosystem II stability/assembly factor-like uncharacterized protein
MQKLLYNANANSVVVALSLFMTAVASSQLSWNRLGTPTDADLRSLAFVDSVNGWVAGKGGTIMRTTDGGITWTVQQTNTQENIVAIFMLNQRVGWALSPYWSDSMLTYITQVHRTTNGGDLWMHVSLPDNYFITISFADSSRGSMGGAQGAFFKSTDGGISWSQAEVDPAVLFDVHKVKFFSPERGYAVGGRFDARAVTWQTTNGGTLWNTVLLDATEPLFDFCFLDSLRIMAVGGDPDFGVAVAHTTDGGLQWDFAFIGVVGIARAVSFRTSLEAWCPLGAEADTSLQVGSAIFTLDGGETWNLFYLPERTPVFDVQFTDAGHGYMVGDSGAVFKFSDTVLNVGGSSDGLPARAMLFQNYPNPFNPATVIRYQVPVSSNVSLKIYNPLGQEIATLVDKVMQSGRYEVRFDGTGLPSGIFFYRLVAGSFLDTRKLLLLR